MSFQHRLILSVAMIMALAACGDHSEAPAANTSSATPGATPSATPNATSDAQINAPIPRDAISTHLELVGQPMYNKHTDSLIVKVRVSNQGKAAFISAGTAMVHLGSMLMGPEGPDKAPGKRDFKRFDLPLVAPGSTVEIEAKFPVTDMNGLPVRFDLVQEGVNWFSFYGEPTLDIGPYKRCDGQEKSLCDASGHAISSP